MRSHALIVAVMLVAGCAVGPNYKRPTVKVPDNYRFATGAATNSLLRAYRPEAATPSDAVFLRMPSMYLLKAHLRAAGIPYIDDQGRQADFHALRHTFATNLSLAGVAPRLAMELMRHSDLRLTMKNYTDASCLPTAAAIDSLPSFNARCSQLCSQKMFPDSPGLSQAVPADN
jgi:integrase